MEIAAEEEDRHPGVLPWWESSGLDEDGSSIGYAVPPEVVSQDVVGVIKPPEGTGVKLAHNTIAIWYVPSQKHFLQRTS